MTRLENASREALAAYRAIGMGPSGWTSRDRIAFAELAAALDELPPQPAAPARRQHSRDTNYEAAA
jgi:hypothetical protein